MSNRSLQDENAELRALLRELLQLMRGAEHCRECFGPSIAFEGVHARQWESLRRRIERLTGGAPCASLPN
jgi:hypothetical protein